MKSEHIVRYTSAELKAMRDRGESLTDWARVDAMTEEELEASIDHEEEGEFDWSQARIGIPDFTRLLAVHLDRDVVDWFKAQGGDYATRMNDVLRAHVEAQEAKVPAGTRNAG